MRNGSRWLTRAALGLTAAAPALIAWQPASAASQRGVESINKRIVRASFDAWSAGKGGPFDLLTADARWTIEGNSVVSKTYPSKEAFMSEVIRPFNARMQTPLMPSIRNLYADGDTVVVFFDARATSVDGKTYNNTYAWFLELRAGKIVKAFAFFDALEFDDLWSRVTSAP